MSVPIIDIDLSLPPAERWHSLRPCIDEAKYLLDFYLMDLGGLAGND